MTLCIQIHWFCKDWTWFCLLGILSNTWCVTCFQALKWKLLNTKSLPRPIDFVLQCKPIDFTRIEHVFVSLAFYQTLGGHLFSSIGKQAFCTFNPCQINELGLTMIETIKRRSWECILSNRNQDFKINMLSWEELTSCWEWRNERCFLGSSNTLSWDAS